MANAIELAKSYVPLLDEVYAREVLTSDLDGAPELVQQGANANELIIPMMDMQGLADYSRNSGYVQGDVTLKNETVKCNFDRGRMFWVDSMDDLETAGIAFGRLAAEFIRTKVGPEIDAFRFATYCSKTGIGKKEETLADGAAVVAALRAATTAMDEDEVSEGDRYLYITPTLYGMISDLDTTKSREILTGFAPTNIHHWARFLSQDSPVLTGFAKIVKVPQKRFHTAIDQLSGGTGEEAGGYKKADGASDLNFVIVHKPAVIQYHKHAAPKIVTPDANQDGDAYKYGYRLVSIADLYANKLAGVYASYKPVAGG